MYVCWRLHWEKKIELKRLQTLLFIRKFSCYFHEVKQQIKLPELFLTFLKTLGLYLHLHNSFQWCV